MTASSNAHVEKFLSETTLFLGPTPDIMRNHSMQPRTEEEERLLAGHLDTVPIAHNVPSRRDLRSPADARRSRW